MLVFWGGNLLAPIPSLLLSWNIFYLWLNAKFVFDFSVQSVLCHMVHVISDMQRLIFSQCVTCGKRLKSNLTTGDAPCREWSLMKDVQLKASKMRHFVTSLMATIKTQTQSNKTFELLSKAEFYEFLLLCPISLVFLFVLFSFSLSYIKKSNDTGDLSHLQKRK